MTVPTKEEFDESIALLESAHAGFLKPSFAPEHFSAEDSVVAKDLLGVSYYALEMAERRVEADKVYSWLMSQPAFARVYDRIFPQSRDDQKIDASSHRNEVTEARYEYLRRLTTNPRLGKLLAARFDRRVDSILGLSDSNPRRWLLTVVLSLRQYHYLNTASKLVDERRQFFSQLNDAIAGMDALVLLANNFGATLRFSTIQAQADVQLPLLDDQFNERLRLLRSMAETDLDSIFPIARLDGTAKERLFVINMAHANRRATGKLRPSEIVTLLELEGFDSQMDDRSIERQCASVMKRWRQLFATS